jgi:hypothetical protein
MDDTRRLVFPSTSLKLFAGRCVGTGHDEGISRRKIDMMEGGGKGRPLL